MAKGYVRWFNISKGHGFIIPDKIDAGGDVFVHIATVEKAGLKTLDEGATVEYDVQRSREGRMKAINLRVLAD